MQVRLFTLDEANKVLPRIRTDLSRAHEIMQSLRNARDQLTDLRIIWGEKILDRECPDHEEYETFHSEFTAKEIELSAVLEAISGLGAEVKDPDLGLVDFHASRGEEIVYLCWKLGEARIEFWHTLTSGFGGRQPITSF